MLFEDNAACIYVAATDEAGSMNPHSKHIDTRIFKLREFVEEKVLKLVKVNSLSNIANCLTRSLGRDPVTMARDDMLSNTDA